MDISGAWRSVRCETGVTYAAYGDGNGYGNDQRRYGMGASDAACTNKLA